MDRNQPGNGERAGTIAARYRVSQQEVMQWIEQGFGVVDVEWAYRFAQTSPSTSVQNLLEMRAQGASWDEVRRNVAEMLHDHRNPAEEIAGRKLVPGGERHASRYFYRDNARNLRQHSGPQQPTGYAGSVGARQHSDNSDSWSDQQSTRKSPTTNNE